jgi:hypothetical protein
LRAGGHASPAISGPAPELARLERLVGNAARRGQTPNFGTSASVVYYIFARRGFPGTAKGHVPPRLVGLVGVLNGLIDRYA